MSSKTCIFLLGLLAVARFCDANAATRPAAPDSPYVPTAYARVFADEFDEPSLDISKWWTRYIYNDGMLDRLNDEKERYREHDNHVLENSLLKLTARKVHDDDPNGINYESGMIRSKTTFKYGYFEARMKVPRGLGVWPAFWLNSDSLVNGKIEWPPEMDILEFVYNRQEDKLNMMHTGPISHISYDKRRPWDGTILFSDAAVKGHDTGEYYAAFDFPDDFHVFALLWDTDDTMITLVDGKPLMKWKYHWVYRDGADAGYAHVLLNLAIGGQWAGRHGIDDKAFPQSLDIDYVRDYQKQGQEKTGQGRIGHDLIQAKP